MALPVGSTGAGYLISVLTQKANLSLRYFSCLFSGFAVPDSYSQQSQFPPVQQLQDSSTLESQALSTSFHQQNLLQVPGSDAVSVVSAGRKHRSGSG